MENIQPRSYNVSEERPPINTQWDFSELLAFISEGNPGALNVMMQMRESFGYGETMMQVLHIDDMNIRGCQIWVAYKDGCASDVTVLRDKILSRDQELVDIVNEYHGEFFPWKATVGGASSNRMKYYEPL